MIFCLVAGSGSYPGRPERQDPRLWQIVLALPLVVAVLVLIGPLLLLSLAIRGLTFLLKRCANARHDNRRRQSEQLHDR